MKTEQILTKTFPGYNCLERLSVSLHENDIQKVLKELDKVFTLLRRFYNIIEDSHLNDHKLHPYYLENFKIPKTLGEEVFNYLSSKDKKFNEIFIKRQKRYRRRKKQEAKKLKEIDERKLYEELKKKFEGK